MEVTHRTFGHTQKPYVAAKRRKQICKAICVRKYGMTPAELAKAKKRKDRRAVAANEEEEEDEERASDVEEEEEIVIVEADLQRDVEEIVASEGLVQLLKDRLTLYKDQKKQLMQLLKMVLKEEAQRKKAAPPPAPAPAPPLLPPLRVATAGNPHAGNASEGATLATAASPMAMPSPMPAASPSAGLSLIPRKAVAAPPPPAPPLMPIPPRGPVSTTSGATLPVDKPSGSSGIPRLLAAPPAPQPQGSPAPPRPTGTGLQGVPRSSYPPTAPAPAFSPIAASAGPRAGPLLQPRPAPVTVQATVSTALSHAQGLGAAGGVAPARAIHAQAGSSIQAVVGVAPSVMHGLSRAAEALESTARERERMAGLGRGGGVIGGPPGLRGPDVRDFRGPGPVPGYGPSVPPRRDVSFDGDRRMSDPFRHPGPPGGQSRPLLGPRPGPAPGPPSVQNFGGRPGPPGQIPFRDPGSIGPPFRDGLGPGTGYPRPMGRQGAQWDGR